MGISGMPVTQLKEICPEMKAKKAFQFVVVGQKEYTLEGARLVRGQFIEYIPVVIRVVPSTCATF